VSGTFDGRLLTSKVPDTFDFPKIVASPLNSQELRVYNVTDGKHLDTIKVGNGIINTVVQCPDETIIVNDSNHKPTAWDLTTKKEKFVFGKAVLTSNAHSFGVAVKQNRIWIPDQRFYIATFSLADGLAKYNAEISSKEQGISVSCSPDERVRLALSAQGDISAFQATPPSVGFKTIATKPGASTILISPDAKTFVVWGPKLPILLYPVAGGKEQQTFKGHTADVIGVAYCHDNKHLISVSLDRTMRIWNIESGKVVKQVTLQGAGAGLALSPDGRLAVTSTFALGMIQVWQLPKEVIP